MKKLSLILLIMLASGCCLERKISALECEWYKPITHLLTEEEINNINPLAIKTIKYNEEQYLRCNDE